MKALVVRQPYAGKIASGRKAVEVRSWRTAHRGLILICAAKKISDRRRSARAAPAPAGCVLALCELTDVRPMQRTDTTPACIPYQPGAWAWTLRLVQRLQPVPLKGRQRVFDVDLTQLPELASQVQAAVPHAH